MTSNQPNLPTPEQWEPVRDALECAARAYWEQQLNETWDYMLDDTELELAKIVREHFPEMDAKCKQQAKERIEEMEDSCRPVEEEQ